jgi:hypothetical protein
MTTTMQGLDRLQFHKGGDHEFRQTIVERIELFLLSQCVRLLLSPLLFVFLLAAACFTAC